MDETQEKKVDNNAPVAAPAQDAAAAPKEIRWFKAVHLLSYFEWIKLSGRSRTNLILFFNRTKDGLKKISEGKEPLSAEVAAGLLKELFPEKQEVPQEVKE